MTTEQKEAQEMKAGILEKLADLLRLAIEERSHYYVASVVREAIDEIKSLRESLEASAEAAAGEDWEP